MIPTEALNDAIRAILDGNPLTDMTCKWSWWTLSWSWVPVSRRHRRPATDRVAPPIPASALCSSLCCRGPV